MLIHTCVFFCLILLCKIVQNFWYHVFDWCWCWCMYVWEDYSATPKHIFHASFEWKTLIKLATPKTHFSLTLVQPAKPKRHFQNTLVVKLYNEATPKAHLWNTLVKIATPKTHFWSMMAQLATPKRHFQNAVVAKRNRLFIWSLSLVVACR